MRWRFLRSWRSCWLIVPVPVVGVGGVGVGHRLLCAAGPRPVTIAGASGGDGWLVARTGSLQRRRDCIAAPGIIGWTVRQTLMQRRAGVATLVAATAAGVKHYQVIDVPADLAWSIAAQASPWVARQQMGR